MTLKAVLESDKWFQTQKNECTMQNGLAWVGAKLYIPQSQQLLVLKKSHNSKTRGHFRFVKTLHLIKWQFWWALLKKDIECYVASCPVCASAKWQQGKTPPLLQPVVEPNAPWKEISMDFIVELPQERREHSNLGDNICFLSKYTLCKGQKNPFCIHPGLTVCAACL